MPRERAGLRQRNWPACDTMTVRTGQPPDDNLAPLTCLAEHLDGHQLQAWTR